MFSLIVTIISIALVSALAVATVYYGGNQFSQGSFKSAGAAIVTSAQQITAANTLYFNATGGFVSPGTVSVAATCGSTGGCFPTAYLNSVPKAPPNSIKKDGTNPGYSVASNNVVLLTVDGGGAQEVCMVINGNSQVKDSSGTVYIPADQATLDAVGVQYGCFGSGPYTFKYAG